MNRPFVTIILAAGKGTRMGNGNRHKVCFEVAGIPVIVRALETYNHCGAAMNVIVVGAMAGSVMTTANERFSGIAYAFQEKQLGTGDAARKGAEILERLDFDGDILIVAGDKVITPKAIRQLLTTHRRTGADVTLATAKRPPESSAGILLTAPKGNIIGILEEPERRRVVAINALNDTLQNRPTLTREAVNALATKIAGEKTALRLSAEIWGARKNGALTRKMLAAKFSRDERLGRLTVAGEHFPAKQFLQRFDQMNLATYLFRAPALYDALRRLKAGRASREEYLTDVIQILAARKPPAKIVGCAISNPNELMAFNTPQELRAIERVYRGRNF